MHLKICCGYDCLVFVLYFCALLCFLMKCFLISHSFSSRALRWMQTMTFAIQEINKRSNLLPQLKLGFHIRDSCDDIPVSLRASLLLVNGQPERVYKDQSVKGDKKIGRNQSFDSGCSAVQRTVSSVIIGDAASGVSMALLRTLGSFHIPLVRLHTLVE